MPEHVTIEGQIDGADVRLVLQSATVLSSMKRSILRGRVSDQLADLDLDNEIGTVAMATLLVGRFTYPDLLAAVVECDGLDVENITLDEFLNLPQEFVDMWYVGVYELCPHWSRKPPAGPEEEEEEAEKKDVPKLSEKSESSS